MYDQQKVLQPLVSAQQATPDFVAGIFSPHTRISLTQREKFYRKFERWPGAARSPRSCPAWNGPTPSTIDARARLRQLDTEIVKTSPSRPRRVNDTARRREGISRPRISKLPQICPLKTCDPPTLTILVARRRFRDVSGCVNDVRAPQSKITRDVRVLISALCDVKVKRNL